MTVSGVDAGRQPTDGNGGSGPSLSGARAGHRVFTRGVVSLLTGAAEDELASWGDAGLLRGVADRQSCGSDLYSLADLKTAAALHDTQEKALVGRAAGLVAAGQAQRDFLRLVAHELRTPMAILRGYLSMIRDGSIGSLQAVLQVVPILEARAREMDSLIQQILEVAHVEDGRMVLEDRLIDLAELLQEAVERALPLAGPRHRITASGPGHGLLVRGDPSRVLIILINLISNAIKYSPEGGEVCCSAEPDGDSVRVVVQDHGIGISEDDQRLLFTPFGRLAYGRASGIPGTGLGLYLARELARAHGGNITVTSREGRGSAFILTIPSAQVEGAVRSQ